MHSQLPLFLVCIRSANASAVRQIKSAHMCMIHYALGEKCQKFIQRPCVTKLLTSSTGYFPQIRVTLDTETAVSSLCHVCLLQNAAMCTWTLCPGTENEIVEITGSAVALHCCKAHSKINRKMGHLTPCKIVTPKNLKTWNFAYVITSGRLPTMQILVLIDTLGASPHIGEILPPCDFFWLSCPVLSCHFFLENAPRSNRWTDFQALWLKRRVFAQGRALSGSGWWVTSSGGNIPTKLPKNWRE